MEFNIQKDCYVENCPDYEFDLEITKRDKAGNILPKEVKSEAYIQE